MHQFLKTIFLLVFVFQLIACAGNKKIFQAVIKGDEARINQYLSEKNDVKWNGLGIRQISDNKISISSKKFYNESIESVKNPKNKKQSSLRPIFFFNSIH